MTRPTVSDLLKMMDGKAHLVAIRVDWTELFGYQYQPECLDCDYLGPFTPEARAHAIAAEHRSKSAGTWRPVR